MNIEKIVDQEASLNYIDDKQREIYKRFSSDMFLGNEKNALHFMQWLTFFRRNLHRFATDYLGVRLHLYQIITLYLMGINRFIVIIAARASAKSFIIALYACCKCILYPGTMIVVASSTRGQSKLIVSEKIEKELMGKYAPRLKKEIRHIKNNQSETIVTFKNSSTITVVTASQDSRGYRSNVIIREECRQIKKNIDDSVLSPYQVLRQPPYRTIPEYMNIPELKEEAVDIYISSSWYDNGSDDTWMWQIVDNAYGEMLDDKASCMLAFDESVAIKHGIKSIEYFQTEKKKQDPSTWALEFLNLRIKENQSAFYSYSLLRKNQVCKQPFYPRTNYDFRCKKKNPYAIPKLPGEIRILGVDAAFIHNNANDNSVFTCMRLLPEKITYALSDEKSSVTDVSYRRIVPYLESVQGGEIKKQGTRIRELFDDFEADYIILDLRNAGIAIYDILARSIYDEERCVEYPALKCMNNDDMANRIKVEGAEARIFIVNATASLNSNIALEFYNILSNNRIEFLVNFETAKEDILPNIKEYTNDPNPEVAFFYERPFLETQQLITETAELVYEKKKETGAVTVYEKGKNRKDRFSSCSYCAWLAHLLELDLLSTNDSYEFITFIN